LQLQRTNCENVSKMYIRYSDMHPIFGCISNNNHFGHVGNLEEKAMGVPPIDMRGGLMFHANGWDPHIISAELMTSIYR